MFSWEDIQKRYADWELSGEGSNVTLLDEKGNYLDELSISGLIDSFIEEMVYDERIKQKLKKEVL